jgi:hypothetical protein
MSDDLDTLLQTDLVSVPDDFAERVMRRVQASPRAAAQPRWMRRLQWVALLGGALVGALEVVTFIFGLWAATAAS